MSRDLAVGLLIGIAFVFALAFFGAVNRIAEEVARVASAIEAQNAHYDIGDYPEGGDGQTDPRRMPPAP